MNGRRIVVDANIAFRALSRGRHDLVAMLRPAGRLADSTWSEDEELKAGLRARGFDRFV